MTGIDYRAYIEVAPDHQKFFETIQGTAPIFDDNRLLLPPTSLTANGENSQLNFSFNLHADLADTKTAEGKTIPVTLKLVRLVNGEDADTKATIPFTIACNSPPPAVKDVQLVKSKTPNSSGNYGIFVLFNFDASEEDLALRHRDLARVTLSDIEHLASPSGEEGINFSQRSSAEFDFDGTTVTTSYTDFSYAGLSSTYETLQTATEPTAITPKSFQFNLNTSSATDLKLAVALTDKQGLQSEQIKVDGKLLRVKAPILKDAIRGSDLATYNTTPGSSNSEQFLKFDASGMGKITAVKPTTTLDSWNSEEALTTNPILEITYTKATGFEESTNTIQYSSETTQTGTAGTDVSLDLTEETIYKVRVKASAPGYLDSEEAEYLMTLQRSIYASASGKERKWNDQVQNAVCGMSFYPGFYFSDATQRLNELEKAGSAENYAVYIEGEVEHTDSETLGMEPWYSFGNKPITITKKSGATTAKIKNPNNAYGSIILSSGNVTLQDITLTCGIYSSPGSGNIVNITLENGAVIETSGLDIEGNSTLTMKAGATIRNSIGTGVILRNGASFTMEGGTIENCTPSSTYYDVKGGGVWVYHGTFNMQGGTIQECSAKYTGTTTTPAKEGFGGGVAVEGGTFTMTGGSIKNNTASHKGGGIYIGSGTGVSAKITGGTIGDEAALNPQGNVALRGAGIYVVNGATFTIENAKIVNNGAEYNTSNKTGTIYGGGISIVGMGSSNSSQNKTYQLKNVTISGNMASTSGGGIYSNGKLSVDADTTITDNTSNEGGGIYIEKDNNASEKVSLTISGGSITNNKAKTSGGGIYAKNTILTMSSGNIDENKVGENNTSSHTYGGGIYLNSCNATISGGQVYKNHALVGDGSDKSSFGGGISSSGSNLIISGSAKINNNTAHYAGGIYSSGQTKLKIEGGEINSNGASKETGGISHSGHNSDTADNPSFIISGGVISDNICWAGGDAPQNYVVGGVSVTTGHFKMTGGNIIHNIGGNIGGLYLYSGSGATITGGIISNNEGSPAPGTGAARTTGVCGGIYVYNFPLTLGGERNQVVNISNNKVYGGKGAGLRLDTYSAASSGNEKVTTIKAGCTISLNQFTSFNDGIGAGVYVGKGNKLVMEGGTINTQGQGAANGGKATNGGGIAVDDGLFYMAGGTITNNSAQTRGGGLYVTGSNAKVYIYGSAVIGNKNAATVANNISYSNSANGGGGGIFIENSANLYLGKKRRHYLGH